MGALVGRVRRGVAVLAAVGLGALLTASPSGAVGALDESQTLDSASIVVSPPYRVAQTFTAGVTGALDQVDLSLARAGAGGDYTVEIRSVDAEGRPTATVLATETVLEAQVGVFPDPPRTWVSVPLSPPAPSETGKQYAIVVSSSKQVEIGDSNLWGGSEGNPYPPGGVFTSIGGGGWEPASATLDAAFKTYVTAGAVPSECSLAPPPGAIIGTAGPDAIVGTAGDDVIFAGAGSDRVDSRGGDDTICGGDGTDLIAAGTGDDTIDTGLGIDTVDAGPGIDTCTGGPERVINCSP